VIPPVATRDLLDELTPATRALDTAVVTARRWCSIHMAEAFYVHGTMCAQARVRDLQQYATTPMCENRGVMSLVIARARDPACAAAHLPQSRAVSVPTTGGWTS